jgi:hypothetical protein
MVEPISDCPCMHMHTQLCSGSSTQLSIISICIAITLWSTHIDFILEIWMFSLAEFIISGIQQVELLIKNVLSKSTKITGNCVIGVSRILFFEALARAQLQSCYSQIVQIDFPLHDNSSSRVMWTACWYNIYLTVSLINYV